MATNPFMNIVLMSLWTWVLTTFAVMAWGAIEQKSLFLPANAISHMVYGDDAFSEEPRPRLWGTGLLLNGAAMIAWSCIAELMFFVFRTSPGEIVSSATISIVTTLLAMIVDFHVVPKRFTPGFERVLSRSALYATYATLALGFFLAALQRR